MCQDNCKVHHDMQLDALWCLVIDLKAYALGTTIVRGNNLIDVKIGLQEFAIGKGFSYVAIMWLCIPTYKPTTASLHPYSVHFFKFSLTVKSCYRLEV